MAGDGAVDATVGLSEAASLAGMSISTIRRWADDGQIPSYRTPGGHRRFRVADVRRALSAAPTTVADATEEFGSMAGSRIRRQLAAPRTRELDWLAGVDDRTRDRLRLLGRHLLSTIEEYLASGRPRAAVLTEARQFGLLYGRELSSAHFTIRQSIEAFTFFRRSIEEAQRRYAAQQALRPAEIEDRRDHLDALNDRLLLGIAEAYEGLPAAEVASVP